MALPDELCTPDGLVFYRNGTPVNGLTFTSVDSARIGIQEYMLRYRGFNEPVWYETGERYDY
jgi:hypothetical protein